MQILHLVVCDLGVVLSVREDGRWKWGQLPLTCSHAPTPALSIPTMHNVRHRNCAAHYHDAAIQALPPPGYCHGIPNAIHSVCHTHHTGQIHIFTSNTQIGSRANSSVCTIELVQSEVGDELFTGATSVTFLALRSCLSHRPLGSLRQVLTFSAATSVTASR